MINISEAQALLRAEGLDGWLFHDFHGRDPLTRELLGLTGAKPTRRMFYLIPAQGEPVKVLSAIEPLLLDGLPGEKVLYAGREALEKALAPLVKGKALACQYSPMGGVPTSSTLDAGTLEYLRSLGMEPRSSADLLQRFGAVLTEKQVESHRLAGLGVHRVLEGVCAWIRQSLDRGERIDEWCLGEKLRQLMDAEGLIGDGPPFFGVDGHAADPGYEPAPQGSREIREGSRLIMDLAARLPGEESVYYDVTWCMQVGRQPDETYARLFSIVHQARSAVVELIRTRLAAGEAVRGWECDRQARQVFEKYGMEGYILHRTGHSIAHECHGPGANLDDYETRDDRRLLPGTLFSVEPGLYMGEYGVRLEFDVYITPEGNVEILGPIQDEILCI